MVILRLSIRSSLPCDFAIFEPKIIKFWNLIEDCIKINDMSGIFDLLSINSGIELEFGPSQIKVFFKNIFNQILCHHISLLRSNDIF
jgi:hypothetical protein